MSTWFSVENNPPPKDRIIEVTSGTKWYTHDYYSKYTKTTTRTWSIRGWTTLAIWKPAVISPLDNVIFEAQFVDLCGGKTLMILPFKYWREWVNPLGNEQEFNAYPPAGVLIQTFEGDLTNEK